MFLVLVQVNQLLEWTNEVEFGFKLQCCRFKAHEQALNVFQCFWNVSSVVSDAGDHPNELFVVMSNRHLDIFDFLIFGIYQKVDQCFCMSGIIFLRFSLKLLLDFFAFLLVLRIKELMDRLGEYFSVA